MDFDPRNYDSRDEDRAPTRDRGGRGGSDRDDERDDDWSRPAGLSRDRDHEARDLGRGPVDSRESHSAERGRDARDDARWPERDRDERMRDADPREVFTRHHTRMHRGGHRTRYRGISRALAYTGARPWLRRSGLQFSVTASARQGCASPLPVTFVAPLTRQRARGQVGCYWSDAGVFRYISTRTPYQKLFGSPGCSCRFDLDFGCRGHAAVGGAGWPNAPCRVGQKC